MSPLDKLVARLQSAMDEGEQHFGQVTDQVCVVWLGGVHQEISQPFQVLALAWHLGRVREAISQLSQVSSAALQLNLLLGFLASNCLEQQQAKSIHV